MALWHIDSYDKLTMFGIRIHGCIDGASHYVLYARVASNKSQETLFEPFSEAIRKFGGPPLRKLRMSGLVFEISIEYDSSMKKEDSVLLMYPQDTSKSMSAIMGGHHILKTCIPKEINTTLVPKIWAHVVYDPGYLEEMHQMLLCSTFQACQQIS